MQELKTIGEILPSHLFFTVIVILSVLIFLWQSKLDQDKNIMAVVFASFIILVVIMYDSPKKPESSKLENKDCPLEKDGNIYQGQCENGKYEGEGRLIDKNGAIYVGKFKNGLHEGSGRLIDKNRNIYIGEFKNDKPKGNGILICNDGKEYRGQFKDGRNNKLKCPEK